MGIGDEQRRYVDIAGHSPVSPFGRGNPIAPPGEVVVSIRFYLNLLAVARQVYLLGSLRIGRALYMSAVGTGVSGCEGELFE